MRFYRTISTIWANILATYYDGYVDYHSINQADMWEFKIKSEWGETLYKSKGLR